MRLLWATLAQGDFQELDKNGIKADSKGGLTRVLFNSGNLGVLLVENSEKTATDKLTGAI